MSTQMNEKPMGKSMTVTDLTLRFGKGGGKGIGGVQGRAANAAAADVNRGAGVDHWAVFEQCDFEVGVGRGGAIGEGEHPTRQVLAP